MDIHELPCRLRSARAKKRLVKTDRDKQLIGLSKRRSILGHSKEHCLWWNLKNHIKKAGSDILYCGKMLEPAHLQNFTTICWLK